MIRAFLLTLALCGAASAGEMEFTLDKPGTKPGERLPVLFEAPDFRLVNQNDQPVTKSDLAGKTWIACFVFTHCAGPCPLMFTKMAGLQQDAELAEVRLVSFTVDPDRDTPQVLRAKARELGADDARWHFLTGIKTATDAVARGMLQPKAGPGDDPLLHSAKFLLIDDQGKCRGLYSSTSETEMAMLRKDARWLAGRWREEGKEFWAAVNASLNGVSLILLLCGYTLIRQRKYGPHAVCMSTAFLFSLLFLVSYVRAYILYGERSSSLPSGVLKTTYLIFLASHVLLAITVLPMIVTVLVRASKRRWDAHKRLAKPTFGIWLYVSTTGIIVYVMLYHLFPALYHDR